MPEPMGFGPPIELTQEEKEQLARESKRCNKIAALCAKVGCRMRDTNEEEANAGESGTSANAATGSAPARESAGETGEKSDTAGGLPAVNHLLWLEREAVKREVLALNIPMKEMGRVYVYNVSDVGASSSPPSSSSALLVSHHVQAARFATCAHQCHLELHPFRSPPRPVDLPPRVRSMRPPIAAVAIAKRVYDDDEDSSEVESSSSSEEDDDDGWGAHFDELNAERGGHRRSTDVSPLHVVATAIATAENIAAVYADFAVPGGELDPTELMTVLSGLGMGVRSQSELDELALRYDSNTNGTIDLDELHALVTDRLALLRVAAGVEG